VVASGVLGAAALWGIWHFMHARNHESTDNAYVAGNVVQITAQTAGTVVAIGADETERVRSGQVLVSLDPSDAKVALEQAQAQLAQTVREVRALYASTSALHAQLQARGADLARAQSEYARLEEDVKRRTPLLDSGAVGREEYEHIRAQLNAARSVVQAAQSAQTAAQEQWQASQAQTEGTPVEQHPQVQRAAARLRETHLALQRSELLAPIDGHLAKRAVQVGQRVQAGAPLMTLVALDALWVDANFKESQLQRLRIGQSAELSADVYGQKVIFHGRISGLGIGTGAAFALLPAQNATGNWIKVVQRVPVRITLDPAEVGQHPLRVGLSMEVNVDTTDQNGKRLADTPRESPVASTQVFDAQLKAADADVQRIIAAHLGTPTRR
jgi:membrane fusion protein (multidrug efflux system)